MATVFDRVRVGPYEISHEIGRGGMAVVFLATDSRDERRVALKLVPAGHDSESREVLEAEQWGARLQEQVCRVSANVPAVYEYGTEGGYFYIAMEYLEGRNLSEVLAAGPLTPQRAVAIATQLCRFLEAAHGFEGTIDGRSLRILLHGDLKPRNIRILDGDIVKVLDFGIAKALSLSRKVTRNDFGSIAYLSPERLESGEIDTHADYWAVGVLLYEMVAGVQPFRAADTRRLEQRIRSLRAPEPLPAACPAGLQAVIGKLLAPAPRDRYEDATAIRADLELVAVGRLPRAQREGWLARAADRDEATRRTQPPAPVDDEATRRTPRQGGALATESGAIANGAGSTSPTNGTGSASGIAPGSGAANVPGPAPASAAGTAVSNAPGGAPANVPGGATLNAPGGSSVNAPGGSSVNASCGSTASAPGGATASGSRNAPGAAPGSTANGSASTAKAPASTAANAPYGRTANTGATPPYAGTPWPGSMPLPKRARRRRPLRMVLLLLALLMALNELAVGSRARRLAAQVPAAELETINRLWERYDSLADRGLSIGSSGLERALVNQTVAVTDRVIGNYRTPQPTVREAQWRMAREALAHALAVNPNNRRIASALRYCDGHLHRINGEARKARKQNVTAQHDFSEAVAAFREAAELRPGWPDPFLGLMRTFIYGLEDVDRGADALSQAEHLGYTAGDRETVQLADGYRTRGQTFARSARTVTGMAQEQEYLTRSAEAYRHAIDLYSKVLAYADVSRSTRAAQRALAQVEQRLAELSENAPPDGAAASPRQSAATPASDVPELSRWQ